MYSHKSGSSSQNSHVTSVHFNLVERAIIHQSQLPFPIIRTFHCPNSFHASYRCLKVAKASKRSHSATQVLFSVAIVYPSSHAAIGYRCQNEQLASILGHLQITHFPLMQETAAACTSAEQSIPGMFRPTQPPQLSMSLLESIH